MEKTAVKKLHVCTGKQSFLVNAYLKTQVYGCGDPVNTGEVNSVCVKK